MEILNKVTTFLNVAAFWRFGGWEERKLL